MKNELCKTHGKKNTNIFQHTKDQASSEVSREHFTISLA